jgi:hypothetical protein
MNTTNITNKYLNVKNQEEDFDYLSLNKRAIRKLRQDKKTTLLNIMLELACLCTYKNGLVGVYKEVTKSALAKELGIAKNNISFYLEQLEKLGYIKIFNASPLVLQILEAPKMPQIDGVKGLLSYVACNPREFFSFNNPRRKNEFFAIFGQQKDEFIKETIKRAEVPEGHSSLPTAQEVEDAFPEPAKVDPPPPVPEEPVDVIEAIAVPIQNLPSLSPAPDESSMQDWNEVFGYSTVTTKQPSAQTEATSQQPVVAPSDKKAPARWPKEHMHRPSGLNLST